MKNLTTRLLLLILPFFTPPLIAQDQPTIQVGTDALLIPVVVRDTDGHSIQNLSQSAFHIYDNGKEKPITGFTLLQSNPNPASNPTESALNATVPATAAITTPAYRFTILLFDDRHLSTAELEQAKATASAYFDQPLTPEDRIVILSFHGVNSGLAKDPTVLKTAIGRIKAQDTTHATEHDCPSISYYQADQILTQHNTQAYNVAYADMDACGSLQRGSGSDPGWQAAQQRLVESAAQRSLALGDADARETLAFLRDVIGSMAKLPGDRTLVLISPGFYTSTQDAMSIGSQIFTLANSLHVTLNTLDISGLSGHLYEASSHGSFAAASTGQNNQMTRESVRANQATLADFAEGTGGIFFHNDNNLASGFQTLAAKPASEYLLQISLKDVKRNGSWHKLTVKLDPTPSGNATVQARRGYYAPTPPK